MQSYARRMALPVFVSYRHADRSAVRALQVELEGRLPADSVLRDVHDFQPGDDLAAAVADAITRAGTVLAVIGPSWLAPEPVTGRLRLGGDDWVRQELALALAWRRPIVPVLVEGAVMPQRDHLPGDIAALSGLVALRLRDTDWDADVSRLVETLTPGTSSAVPKAPPPSVVDAGPIAGGNITISGTNVAGRDLVSPAGGSKSAETQRRRRRWRR